MNRNTPQNFIIAILVFVIMMFSVAQISKKSSPQVVVNWPKDAKLLETIPNKEATVFNNDKAVLWWTVYKATFDKSGSSYDGWIAANNAIEAVYKQ